MSHAIPSSNEFLFTEWRPRHLSLERFKCNFLCHCMFDLGGRPWLGDLAHFQKPLLRFLPQRFGCFLFWFGFGHQHDIDDQTLTICKLVSFRCVLTNFLCGLLKLKAMYTAYGLAAMPFDWIRQGAAGRFRLWSFLSKLHHGRGKQTPSEQRHDVETSIATIRDAKLEVCESMALKFVQVLFHVEIQRLCWWHLLYDTCYLHRQKDRYRSIQQKPQLNSETDI